MSRFGRYLRDSIREFFLGYVILLVLVPILGAAGFANDPPVGERYFLTWVYLTLVMFLNVGLLNFSYDLVFARLGGDFFSLRAIPFHLLAIPSSVLLAVGTTSFVLSPLLPAEMLGYLDFVWRIAALIGCPISVIVANAYDRYRQTRLRELALEREALVAQVQALQSRIQPHFLFNSLNAVASLIGENPKRAERAVEKLSALFRYANLLEPMALARSSSCSHWSRTRCSTASPRASRAGASSSRSGASRPSCSCGSRTTGRVPAARPTAARAALWPTCASASPCSTANAPRSRSTAAPSAASG